MFAPTSRSGHALHRYVWLLLTCLLLLLPAGAKELRLGVSVMPRSVDPHFGISRTDQFLHAQVYEGLADTDVQQEPVPRLAQRWERQGDGVWLFHLRRNVLFQNGQPFRARDVLFSFCRTRFVANSARPYARFLKRAAVVAAVDDYTIRVQLNDDTVLFPIDIAAIPIIAAPPGTDWQFSTEGCATADRVRDTDFANPSLGAGTGPYRLVSFSPDRVTMRANPRHWGNAPDWQGFQVIRLDGADRVRAIVEGRVDILDSPPFGAVAFMKDRTDVKALYGASSALAYLQVNVAAGAKGGIRFDDVRVRRAIMMAIPREALAQRVLPGIGTATGQIPLKGATARSAEVPDEMFDPEQARHLLAEAGYPDGFKTTILAMPSHVRVAKVLAHFLAAIGINATVFEEAQDRFLPRVQSGDFEIYCAGWVFTPGNIAQSYHQLLGSTPPGLSNYGRYANPALDMLLASIEREPSATKRDDLTRSATRMVHDDAALIPLFHTWSRWIIRDGVILAPRMDRGLRAADVRDAANHAMRGGKGPGPEVN